MNILRSLCRTANKTILVATHELDLALQTADRIWLAHDRKIVSGIPEDLVLDGTFDEVFQFKGFDLKTGKMRHEAFQNISLSLIGNGHPYLWTKNALERCGYFISPIADLKLEITETEGKLVWSLKDKTKTSKFYTLDKVLESLKES